MKKPARERWFVEGRRIIKLYPSQIRKSRIRAIKKSGSTETAEVIKFWRHGQVVKTSPFHGGITGSNPVGVILVDTAETTCSNHSKKVTTTASLSFNALIRNDVPEGGTQTLPFKEIAEPCRSGP